MPVIFGLLAVALGLIGLTLSVLHLVRRARAAPSGIVGALLSTALIIGAVVFAMGARVDTPVDPNAVAISTLPEAPGSAGRQLRSDRTVVAAWREVRWPPGRLRLDVPADWAERRNEATQLDLRPASLQTTFVTARLSAAPELGPDDFLRIARLQASSRLAALRITGYAVKTLGGVSGVLSFERSKEDTKEQLSWTGIVPGSNQMITIALGAASENFAQTEPVLGAILDSIRLGDE